MTQPSNYEERIADLFDIFEKTGQRHFAFYIRLWDEQQIIRSFGPPNNRGHRLIPPCRYLLINIGTIEIHVLKRTGFAFIIEQKEHGFISRFMAENTDGLPVENKHGDKSLDDFFQLVLPKMKTIKTSDESQEVSFSFLFNLKSMIKKFPLYLNEKTNSMIAQLNFYGGLKYRIAVIFGWYETSFWKYIRAQKNFNPPPQKRNRALIIRHREDLYNWYEDLKEIFWTLTNPQKVIATFPVINLNFGIHFAPDQKLFNSVSVLWTFKTLITHGLHGLGQKWHEFLTKGLYDPRLLILIEEFLRPKNEKKYDWVRPSARARWDAYPLGEKI